MFGLLAAGAASGVAGGAASGLMGSSGPAAPAAPPSFMSDVGSSLKDGVASGIGSIPGQALQASVGSRMAGRAHRNFQDGAFPGTTPFDRLSGSNGSSGSSGGPSDAVRVAKINAHASERVARINSTAPLSRENREASAGTASAQALNLRSQASLNSTRRLLEQAKLPRAVLNSKAASDFAAADLTEAQSKSIVNATANLIRRAGGASPESVAKGLSHYGDAIAERVLSLYRAFLDDSSSVRRRLPRLPDFKNTK
ncbi:MAG: hypothetical protein [Microviridae sp.]|nr:MAG: hypothetical protein [Microviridae sp.]